MPSSRLILCSHISPDHHHKYLMTQCRQRHARKVKRSRSIREHHDTKDGRRQVFLRHSVHLWDIDLCHRGRQRPEDAAPRVGTRAPHSDFIIDIRRILLRIRSLCKELHPHHQYCLGNLGRDIHSPALRRNIELIVISIDA
jgi:hypothetical protein